MAEMNTYFSPIYLDFYDVYLEEVDRDQLNTQIGQYSHLAFGTAPHPLLYLFWRLHHF